MEVAEKGKKSFNKEFDQTHNTFIWQNNLLKFYLTHNIDKAIDYSHEILDEAGPILQQHALADLKFNLATAYNLRGDDNDLDDVIRLYTECLGICREENAPFVMNNIGMAHFFNFA